MSKQGKGLLKVLILATAFVAQSNTIASVIMAPLSEYFPTASPTVIQYVMQMGMIGAFPISLAVGFLSRKFRIKPLLLIGLALIAIGGLTPIFYHENVYFLWACAFIIGAGQGFLGPLIGTIILTTFTGDEKNTMLGLNTFFGTGGATVLLLIAGQIALRSGWVATYWIYGLSAIVFVLILLLFPLGEKPKPAAADTGTGEKVSKAPVPAKAWIQCFLGTLMFIGYVTFPITVSMFVEFEGLGTAASTANAMSLITVISALMGLAFRFIIPKVKLYIGTCAALFGFLGMLLTLTAQNLAMVYVSAFCLGIFFGCNGAGGGYVVSRICRPDQIGPTFSVLSALVTFGVILSPMIINPITALWNGEVTPRAAFTTSTVWFGVVLVLMVIWNTYLTRTTPPEQAPAAE